MLQCYVLTCGRLVTAFLAPPRSQRPGQGPRSPHPKASPAYTHSGMATLERKSKINTFLTDFDTLHSTCFELLGQIKEKFYKWFGYFTVHNSL
jgi:hypothetical protein